MRYSIKDSQDKVFTFVNSSVEIPDLAKKLLQESEEECLQPFIIIEGVFGIFKIKRTFVFLDNIVYETDSVLHALDICFKAFFVFDLKYPEQASLFWHFIQRFFFKIKTVYDKEYQRVNILINALK